MDQFKVGPDLISYGTNDLIEFEYTNHSGLNQTRQCYIMQFAFGKTPYHKEPQWFVISEDPTKGMRTFALNDMRDVRIKRRATR